MSLNPNDIKCFEDDQTSKKVRSTQALSTGVEQDRRDEEKESKRENERGRETKRRRQTGVERKTEITSKREM